MYLSFYQSIQLLHKSMKIISIEKANAIPADFRLDLLRNGLQDMQLQEHILLQYNKNMIIKGTILLIKAGNVPKILLSNKFM